MAFFCLASFGCVAYADGPYHGRLIDAQTKQPIVGAVVFAQWWQKVDVMGAHSTTAYYDAQETLTDQQGNFVIPGIMNPPKGPTPGTGRWQGVMMTGVLKPPTFIIFKPGYEAIGGRRLEPVPPEVQARLKVKDNVYEENGIMVVEVRRLTTREERIENLRKLFVSDAPREKYPNLISLRNAERVNLGMNPY